jgi:hypothetical protein
MQKITHLIGKGSVPQQLSALEQFRRIVGYRLEAAPDSALRETVDAFVVSRGATGVL